MDNALMLGLQTQRVLQRRMDIAANNIANISTSGFKADVLVTREDDATAAHTTDDPSDIRFVRDPFELTDMDQGSIANTGNPLDVAIQGDGFFKVQGPNGQLMYTRNGAFSISADGHLVTADGRQVLSQGGSPILIDESQVDQIHITRDGAITAGQNEIGRLGVVSFGNDQTLEKAGENLWRANGEPARDFDGVLVQGALEGSNVSPVLELSRLIEISRAYETASQIVANADQLRQQAISGLGAVQ